jgi:hypothetical protein
MPASDLTTSDVRYVEIKPGYRVGDDGSVWSCIRPGRYHRFGSWHRLKPLPQRLGHSTVYLGRKDQRYIHRLVLEAFVGPCPDGMECRHLDGNPGNNRLDNLAWGTRAENQADSIRHETAYHLRPEGRMHARHLWDHVEHKSGEKHHRAKLTDNQVAIIRAIPEVGRRNEIAGLLAQEWDVTPQTITMIARGLRRCSP